MTYVSLQNTFIAAVETTAEVPAATGFVTATGNAIRSIAPTTAGKGVTWVVLLVILGMIVDLVYFHPKKKEIRMKLKKLVGK